MNTIKTFCFLSIRYDTHFMEGYLKAARILIETSIENKLRITIETIFPSAQELIETILFAKFSFARDASECHEQ